MIRREIAHIFLPAERVGDNTKAQTHDAFSGRLDSGCGGLSDSGCIVAGLPVALTACNAKSAHG